MRVEFVWSMEADRYACLHIPHGVSLAEFEELERAVLIQLSVVRRSLEAEQLPAPPPEPVPGEYEDLGSTAPSASGEP